MTPLARTVFPSTGTVVTDAGLETWLIFQRGVDLPAFAAYPLAGTTQGRQLLIEYYEHFVSIARSSQASLVLEAPTWRANPDWAARLGHDLPSLAKFIVDSVELLERMRTRWHEDGLFLVGGAVGPRGDGYRIETMMSADAAADYHSFEIDCLAGAGVDVVTAMTLGYVDEAIGICRAAAAAGLPAVISFTVETDGRLPSGTTIGEAIEATDAATDRYPTHYMLNCAHPSHFDFALRADGPWRGRIAGLRANASALSHAELDESMELDDGDPDDLAARYLAMRTSLPNLRILGGCCGTDHRHVAAMAAAWGTIDRRTA